MSVSERGSVVVHLIPSGSGDGGADGHDMSPSVYHAYLTRPLEHASVHLPPTARPLHHCTLLLSHLLIS